jgi:hypothetical protein
VELFASSDENAIKSQITFTIIGYWSCWQQDSKQKAARNPIKLNNDHKNTLQNIFPSTPSPPNRTEEGQLNVKSRENLLTLWLKISFSDSFTAVKRNFQ